MEVLKDGTKLSTGKLHLASFCLYDSALTLACADDPLYLFSVDIVVNIYRWSCFANDLIHCET